MNVLHGPAREPIDVTLDRFGLSGPGPQVQAALGFTAERVAAVAAEVSGR